jgi:hypothetical protein
MSSLYPRIYSQIYSRISAMGSHPSRLLKGHCLDHLSLAGGEGVEILAAAKKQALRSLKD